MTEQSRTSRLFAEQGGESLTVDEKGNVYIAAGQVYVYNPSGELIDTIDVPERPSQLFLGARSPHIVCSGAQFAVCPWSPIQGTLKEW